MTHAYYNEIDANAAQWLRNLIAAGHIAAGDVDERSIVNVRSADLDGYDQCHFFAGVGVWSYALREAGWADGRQVWTGSCPCQPFSNAGRSGGFDDERHLWPYWQRLISERRPLVVFGEQVASDDGLAWLDFVCADLEAEGYTLGTVDTCAASVGAPNIRPRLFWVADTESQGRRRRDALEAWGSSQPRGSGADVRSYAWPDGFGSGSTLAVADVLSPSYGTPGRVGRLRAYGNAINAEVAAEFIRAYLDVRNA